MRTTHMCLSIRGFLNKTGRDFTRACKAFTDDAGKRMTPAQVRNAMYDELAKGHEVLPLGECDNFDFIKGCQGHVTKEEATDAVGP